LRPSSVARSRFAIFGPAAVLLVLDESCARPRYLAQQWTIALERAPYQAAYDQQFQGVKGILLPRTLPDLIDGPSFEDD
jgi:hypothetical protein